MGFKSVPQIEFGTRPQNSVPRTPKEEVRENISGVSEWNEKYGRKGLIQPLVEEWLLKTKMAKTELIYYYPAGLYINYEIDEAYYFPRSGYILVFTRQPMLAVGLNTQHGFLVLKRD